MVAPPSNNATFVPILHDRAVIASMTVSLGRFSRPTTVRASMIRGSCLTTTTRCAQWCKWGSGDAQPRTCPTKIGLPGLSTPTRYAVGAGYQLLRCKQATFWERDGVRVAALCCEVSAAVNACRGFGRRSLQFGLDVLLCETQARIPSFTDAGYRTDVGANG